MKLTVKCNICDELLVEVVKAVFSHDDEDLYRATCACNTHAQEDIVTEIAE